jgi:Annexin
LACLSLQRVADAYKRLFGRELEDDTEDDTSLDFEDGLLYILRQAKENLIWVPDTQMLRIRDV